MLESAVKETTALLVPSGVAQQIRAKLESMKLWDGNYRLQRLAGSELVAIPISEADGAYLKSTWPDFNMTKIHLPVSKKIKAKEHSPAHVLLQEVNQLLNLFHLPEHLLSEVPAKWERHGDLVILPKTSFSSDAWNIIGNALWSHVAKCLACHRLARHSVISDDGFRSSKVTMLLGESGKVTHVDNGIKYSYDVTKCMFSAGNISEKLRIAKLDCSTETVVDLYAGIGYFTLPYLVHAKALHVHACEWNPCAVASLQENLEINGVANRCTVHEGDNRLLQLRGVADRVNLGLIPSSEEGWPVAVRLLKPQGGILHIHGNVTAVDTKFTGLLSKVKDSPTNQQISFLPEEDGKACNCRSFNIDTTEYYVETHHPRIGNSSSDQLETATSSASENDVPSLTLSSAPGHFSDECFELSNASSKKCVDSDREVTSERGLNEDKSESGTRTSRLVLTACQNWSDYTRSQIVSLLQAEKEGCWDVRQLHLEVIKSYAPHIFHVVVDLHCLPFVRH